MSSTELNLNTQLTVDSCCDIKQPDMKQSSGATDKTIPHVCWFHNS